MGTRRSEEARNKTKTTGKTRITSSLPSHTLESSAPDTSAAQEVCVRDDDLQFFPPRLFVFHFIHQELKVFEKKLEIGNGNEEKEMIDSDVEMIERK